MRIRRHREDAEEQRISARPKRWPEGKVEAAAAMADGQKLPGHTQNGHTSHQTPKEKVGEREESEGILTAGKSKDGEGSGTAVCAEVRTADRRSSSVRRLWGFRGVNARENGAGEQQGHAGGSAPIYRG